MTQQTGLNPDLCYCEQPDVEHQHRERKWHCHSCNKLFSNYSDRQIAKGNAFGLTAEAMIIRSRQAERSRVEAEVRLPARETPNSEELTQRLERALGMYQESSQSAERRPGPRFETHVVPPTPEPVPPNRAIVQTKTRRLITLE